MASRLWMAIGAIAALMQWAAPTRAVVIGIADTVGQPGLPVQIDVRLQTEGALVVGTQNDIGSAPPLRVRARGDGTPDCTPNPDINKDLTVFAFLPSGCVGTYCTSMRALVLALGNVDPIPDGVVLYSCVIEITEGSPGEMFPLSIGNVAVSDPSGTALPVTGRDGAITLVATRPSVTINAASGHPGDTVAVDVTVDPFDILVGTRIDIGFDPQTPIAADAVGLPRCTDHPSIDDGNATFRFLPAGCSPGVTCTATEALVFSLENAIAIDGGLRLFTCDVAIAASAAIAESYPLTCSNARGSDAQGNALEIACLDGAVHVGSGGPENTPVDYTPAASQPTPSPSPTKIPAARSDDDGCQIVSPPSRAGAWPAMSAVWLWWLWHTRRRRDRRRR